jgi:hypothetical protein
MDLKTLLIIASELTCLSVLHADTIPPHFTGDDLKTYKVHSTDTKYRPQRFANSSEKSQEHKEKGHYEHTTRSVDHYGMVSAPQH